MVYTVMSQPLTVFLAIGISHEIALFFLSLICKGQVLGDIVWPVDRFGGYTVASGCLAAIGGEPDGI